MAENKENGTEVKFKPMTLSEFSQRIKSGGKVTSAEVLNSMADSPHMKSDISNPLTYVLMHAVADWEEQSGEPTVAEIDRQIAIYGEQFSSARNGKRADKMLEAIESVLAQDFEIEKSKAKRLMGQ